MEGIKLPKFEDWGAEKIKDPDFLAAAEKLEPGYQVARLRLIRGLTQAQLAEMVGTRQPSIADWKMAQVLLVYPSLPRSLKR
jgi:DNA-binding transcriptional regulator YiaG